jgi:hypothetical protein
MELLYCALFCRNVSDIILTQNIYKEYLFSRRYTCGVQKLMRKLITIFVLWILLTISFTSIFLTETSLADSDEVLIYDEDPEDNSFNVSISISTISVMIQHLDGKTFNWTITTSPDIGSSSGINEHDGVKNCTIDNLSYSTLYIWNVTVYDNVNWTNQSFCFTTSSVSNRPPYTPRNPFPTNSSTNVSVFSSLSWSGGDPDGDNVTYDVYFGTTDSPPKVVNKQSNLSYYPPETLSNNTVYYWKIVAWDDSWCFYSRSLVEFHDVSFK